MSGAGPKGIDAIGIVKLVDRLPLPAFVEGAVPRQRPRRQPAGHRALTAADRRRQPAPRRVPRPCRARPLPGTGTGPPKAWSPDSASQSAPNTDDPRFIELVGELSLASDRFRQLCARHDVGPRQGAALRFDHPQLGELRLNREKLLVGGTDNIVLVIYHPDAGTDAETKLALLACAAITPKCTRIAPADDVHPNPTS